MKNNSFNYDPTSSKEQNYDRISGNRSIYPRSFDQESSNEQQAYLIRKILLSKCLNKVSTLVKIYDLEKQFYLSQSTKDNIYADMYPVKDLFSQKLCKALSLLQEIYNHEFDCQLDRSIDQKPLIVDS